ncbi:unnamed protein product [Lymnaea stagnalis]|uniref:LicD/FKTN/FKRP nucleotidyltransferase domain-containing protein n=1 Tax=Lymnaea stagnalis TaxID=6523 RepID=A0AAV2HX59_LYMST
MWSGSVFNRIAGFSRKLLAGRGKLPTVLASTLLFVYAAVFVIPVRNVVLYPAIEFAWRDVETSDLIRIHFGDDVIPSGLHNRVSCSAVEKPKLSRADINTSAVFTYPDLRKPTAVFEVLEKGHGRFLPTLNLSQKVENLYLYRAAAAALDSVGVKHFLVAGTVLGLNRHNGFVPWDDDMDLSVSLDSWDLVKQTLSCIEGFTLNQFHILHWKFQFSGREYPFLDIFFYRMDETYVWAATSYTRKTYIYPTEFVFPLSESTFEGVKVPVPRNSLGVARRIYDYDICKAFRGHIERSMILSSVYPNGYAVSEVPCKDLSYMYTMFNLEDS